MTEFSSYERKKRKQEKSSVQKFKARRRKETRKHNKDKSLNNQKKT